MKKLFILFIISCCTSCTTRISEVDISYFQSIHSYKYKGHNYIFFGRGYEGGYEGGIVHDPECPCHKTLK